ncbi:MAG TPA: hypothetical protein VFS64_02700 [Solirubrobacterales bacterium]|nr:hypothetical protein [Solirubrobacterales bacterium]
MKRFAPLVFVAFALVAGCGSSSASSSSAIDAATSGEASLSKAEFVAKADALCEESKARQEPLRRRLEEVTRKARGEEQSDEGLTDGTRRELARTLGQIVAMAEASLTRVRALGIPKADSTQLEAIFRKIESAFEGSLAYGAALVHHEDAKAQATAERADAETRATADLARQYGFKVCGAQP